MEKEKLSSYDECWKVALNEYFPEFMELFYPDAYQEINWNIKYETLDSELQKIMPDSNIGRRHCDKLIKVVLNNGTETIILIHIEVQGDHDSSFPKRMFVYHYRIFDNYIEDNIKLMSLGILGDADNDWIPNCYESSLWGWSIRCDIPIIKLNALRSKLEENKHNPFALIALAYLNSKDTRKRLKKRKSFKTEFFKFLISSKLEKEKIRRLLTFIDWMLLLPKELETEFTTEINKIEEEFNVEYINSFERAGIEKGLQQGTIVSLSDILATKFNETPSDIKVSLEKIGNIETLKQLLREAVKANSIEEFRVKLEAVK